MLYKYDNTIRLWKVGIIKKNSYTQYINMHTLVAFNVIVKNLVTNFSTGPTCMSIHIF